MELHEMDAYLGQTFHAGLMSSHLSGLSFLLSEQRNNMMI